MKYLKIFVFITGLFVIGCSVNAKADQTIEKKETVKVKKSKSESDVKTEERNLTGFSGVAIGSTISANITVGQEFKVLVEADEEIISKVITKVKDNKLIVRFEKDFWKDKRYKSKNRTAKVTITLPTLDDIDVSGASSASVAGVNINKLTIDVSGASKLSIEGTANEIDVDLSGASSLAAKSLNSQVAVMDLSGASSAKVSVSSSLQVDASGASSVRYIGSPSVRKDTSGASSIRQM